MPRRGGVLAEREGFEPSEEETPFNGLANRRTRPLCDLSVAPFYAPTCDLVTPEDRPIGGRVARC